MQVRPKKISPPAPFNSEESNPFYLNSALAGSTHYLMGDAERTPFLYTTEITSCVGIGFYDCEGGRVRKLGLYHSYSEHDFCQDKFVIETLHTEFERRYMSWDAKNLIRAIYHFLFDVKDINTVFIVIHNSSIEVEDVNDPDDVDAYLHITALVNQVSRLMGKGELGQRHFLYSQGSTTFCVMKDGSYFAALVDGSKDEEMAKKIALFIYDDIAEMKRTPGFLKGKPVCFFNGRKAKVSSIDQHMLHYIEQANSGTMGWIEACYRINQEWKTLTEKNKPVQKAYANIGFMLQFLDQAGIFRRSEFATKKMTFPNWFKSS